MRQFTEEYPNEEFAKKVKEDLEVRKYFVKKFPLNKIMSMTLDDYVIGKADITESGKDSFCYLIERKMLNIGEIRGSKVDKFGVWFSKNHEYKFTKKYGKTLNETFENLKKEICGLLISASNDDYKRIENNKIAV